VIWILWRGIKGRSSTSTCDSLILLLFSRCTYKRSCRSNDIIMQHTSNCMSELFVVLSFLVKLSVTWINMMVSHEIYDEHILGSLFPLLILTAHIWECCHRTAFPRSSRYTWGIYHIVRTKFSPPYWLVRALCYRSLCRNLFQLAITYKFMAPTNCPNTRIIISRCRLRILRNHTPCKLFWPTTLWNNFKGGVA